MTKAEQEYAQLLGRVTMKWNDLHVTFQLLFSVLLHDKPRKIMRCSMGTDALGLQNMGPALWHSLSSDDAQRSLLAAAIKVRLPEDSIIRGHLLWIIDCAGKLSAYRNDSVHVYVWDQGTRRRAHIAPDPMFGPPKRVTRLLAVGDRELYNALISDIVALKLFLTWQMVCFASGKERNASLLPRFPLQSILLVEKSPQVSQRRQPPRTTRKRQRRSSPT